MKPFKVICIDDKPHIGATAGSKLLKEGLIYTVVGQRICKHGGKKGQLVYDLLGFNPALYQFWSKRFAPIQENYSDATAEILEKFKQTTEVPDKVLVPEKTLMENQ
jgi:hypothetical protein